jgi:hypothetical protein
VSDAGSNPAPRQAMCPLHHLVTPQYIQQRREERMDEWPHCMQHPLPLAILHNCGSCPVTDGSVAWNRTVDGNVTYGAAIFNATVQLQRPALKINGGKLFVAFGSHSDRNVQHRSCHLPADPLSVCLSVHLSVCMYVRLWEPFQSACAASALPSSS